MPILLRYQELMSDPPSAWRGQPFRYCCVLCGLQEDDPLLNRCVRCSGAIDAVYNLDRVEVRPMGNPLQRYFPLLPIHERASMLWLGEGDTPCFHAERLGEKVGLSRLFVKDETANPTRSTKDRIASIGLSRFSELGIKNLVVASTGNSSTAYARGVQEVGGFRLHVFVARCFLDRLNYLDHPDVNTYVVDGDFVAAGEVAQRFAARTDYFLEGGFFSLSRREGLKIAYLEAFDQMPVAPEYVFQAVSSGMGLLGAYKGALEYQRLGRITTVPRFVAVQQSSCAPMAHAYAQGEERISSRHVIRNPTGIAQAILRGDPTQSYPYVLSVCTASGGRVMAVDEHEIRQVRDLLAETEGIQVCFSGATALAGAMRLRTLGILPADAPTLVNLTGADRPPAPVPRNVLTW